jgi:hypothetical protein
MMLHLLIPKKHLPLALAIAWGLAAMGIVIALYVETTS